MPTRTIALEEQRVNLKFLLISLVLFLVGLAAAYAGTVADWWTGWENLRPIVQLLGNLVMTTITLNSLWQMWGRRAFLDEVLAKVSMSKELTFAGIAKVSDSFHDADIDWNRLFSTTNRLDVFFSYGHTWRATHSTKLRDLASKSGAKIRVVLPDPDNDMVVGELARRFSKTPERMREYIMEAEKDFSALRERGAQVEIFFLPMAPLFTFYRFDSEAVLAFHNHRLGRNPVPTFIVRRGGTLWSYLKEEFHGMIDTGFARRAT